MDLRDMLQAIREYPAARAELRQAQQALERSEQERKSLSLKIGEQSHYVKLISHQSVEIIDGELYGVAVCQISGTLTPGELEELREYFHSQYTDGNAKCLLM